MLGFSSVKACVLRVEHQPKANELVVVENPSIQSFRSHHAHLGSRVKGLRTSRMLGYSFAKACALLVEHHPRANKLVVDGCLGVMQGRNLFTLEPRWGRMRCFTSA
jgi:hypothetical protein